MVNFMTLTFSSKMKRKQFQFLILLGITLLSCIPTHATVYEFATNGQTVTHEAVDYLSKSRQKKTASHVFRRLKNNGNYDHFIEASAKKYDLSPLLIKAVIQTESSFNANAVSPKGAEGLMQLMPPTAKRFGVSDSFDPEQNIDGGAQYLRFLLKRYNQNTRLSVAAYNAGEGAVDKYNGIPPYRETIDYVEKIEALLDVLPFKKSATLVKKQP